MVEDVEDIDVAGDTTHRPGFDNAPWNYIGVYKAKELIRISVFVGKKGDPIGSRPILDTFEVKVLSLRYLRQRISCSGTPAVALVRTLLDIEVELLEIPCASNPLGVKGAGEAGAVGSPPAVINAIIDALSGDGVTHIDMPATPERVWRAVALAKAA